MISQILLVKYLGASIVCNKISFSRPILNLVGFSNVFSLN